MFANQKNIMKALAKFQQACPIIHKGTEGYGYSYASFDSIVKTINPLMNKVGLGFTQLVETIEGATGIRTILFHSESGETIESFVEMPKGVILKGMNEFQVMGSAITYYKRYSISSMLGIITDKDLDACGEQLTGNGINYPSIDPMATGDELDEQLKKAIVSISKRVESRPVTMEDLEGDFGELLRATFEDYLKLEQDFNATKWIDEQLNKPRKSGTIDALRELWKEAEKRNFLTPYVELKIKERKGELEDA